jgi:hypothetical protein
VPLEALPTCVALGTARFYQQNQKKSINQLSYSWNLEPKHAVYEDDTSWLLTDFPNNTRKGRKKLAVGIYLTMYQISEPTMSAIYHNMPNLGTNHDINPPPYTEINTNRPRSQLWCSGVWFWKVGLACCILWPCYERAESRFRWQLLMLAIQ